MKQYFAKLYEYVQWYWYLLKLRAYKIYSIPKNFLAFVWFKFMFYMTVVKCAVQAFFDTQHDRFFIWLGTKSAAFAGKCLNRTLLKDEVDFKYSLSNLLAKPVGFQQPFVPTWVKQSFSDISKHPLCSNKAVVVRSDTESPYVPVKETRGKLTDLVRKDEE